MNAHNRTISTEDGRKICILEAGQPDGVPVLVHKGTPNSRLLYDPWVEDAQSRGIRLISYDRPGCGRSTAHRDRTVASAANDVAAIAKELGLNRLLVWGISGGGPHALACAALLPGLVVAAAVRPPTRPKGWTILLGWGKTILHRPVLHWKAERLVSGLWRHRHLSYCAQPQKPLCRLFVQYCAQLVPRC